MYSGRYYLDETRCALWAETGFLFDGETGLRFRRNDLILNKVSLEAIPSLLEDIQANPKGDGIIQIMNHEQYFYADYPDYQEDYEKKMERAIAWLTKNSYRSCFFEDTF
jgi:hypothetical protein